jgi:hypothetical protein
MICLSYVQTNSLHIGKRSNSHKVEIFPLSLIFYLFEWRYGWRPLIRIRSSCINVIYMHVRVWNPNTHKQENLFPHTSLSDLRVHNHYITFKLQQNRLAHIYSWNIKTSQWRVEDPDEYMTWLHSDFSFWVSSHETFTGNKRLRTYTIKICVIMRHVAINNQIAKSACWRYSFRCQQYQYCDISRPIVILAHCHWSSKQAIWWITILTTSCSWPTFVNVPSPTA